MNRFNSVLIQDTFRAGRFALRLGILGALAGHLVLPAPSEAQNHNSVFSYTYPGGNLVRNGSFENNYSLTEYEGWYEGLTQDPAAFLPLTASNVVPPFEGRRYMATKYACQTAGEPAWKIMSESFLVKAGKTYSLFFRYQSDIVTNGTTSNVVRPGVRFWSAVAHEFDPETRTFSALPAAAGQSHEVTPAAVGPAGYQAHTTWTPYSMQFTAPAGSVFARVFLVQAEAVGNGGAFSFDDVYLVEGAVSPSAEGDPLHPSKIGKVLAYTDARANVLQTVVPDGERDIVTQNQFDVLGREEKGFRPIAENFATNPDRPAFFGSYKHEFIPDITGQFDIGDRLSNFYTSEPVDAVNGPRTYQVNLDDTRLPGESAQDPYPQFPDAEGVPFSQVRYETSPLARVVESASPGLIWKMGGASIRTHYLSVTSIQDNGDLATPIGNEGEFHVLQVAGQHDQNTREFRDRLDRVVRTSAAKTLGVPGDWVNTDYEYDAAGNLVKTLAPPDASGNRLTTIHSYDALGQVVATESQSTGKTWFIHDDAGRQRFSRTAEQDGGPLRPNADKPFSFVKYDALGRVIANGTISDGTLFSDSKARIEGFPCVAHCMDPSSLVPSSKVKFRNLFSYDREGQSLSCVDGPGPENGSGFGSPPSQDIAFVAESPAGEAVACSYDLYSTYTETLAKLQGGSGEVRILALYDPQGNTTVEPDPGTEFLFSVGNLDFTFEAVSLASPEGPAGQALFDECRSNKLATKGFFKGRLVKSLTCNHELSLALGDPGPREVSQSFQYDAFGNVAQSLEVNRYIESAGKTHVTTRFAYDRKNRLVQKKVCGDPDCSDAGSHVENISYDHLSRLEKVADRNGSVVAHNHYDKLGQLTARAMGGNIEPGSGNAILEKNKHHLHGQLKSTEARQIRDNAKLFGENLRYEDAVTPRIDGTVAEAEYSYPGGSPIPSLAYSYTYDLLSRTTNASAVPAAAGASTAYAYSDDDRLASQTRAGATGAYLYDADGRLEQVTGSLIPERPMQKTGPGDVIFRYDRNGNLVEDNSKEKDGQPFEIFYRSDNLPYMMVYKERVGSTGPFLEKVQYMAYDAGGNRVSKIEYSEGQKSAAKSYFGSGKEVREAKDQASWVATEIFGLSSYGRVQYTSAAPQGHKEFYITDHLGSVRTLYDFTNGTTPFSTHYFPFGAEFATAQSTQDVTPGFTGKESDQGLGLTYFGARYFDQDLGLWTSPDPARQFHSPYSYGNPVNSIDPDGLKSWVFADLKEFPQQADLQARLLREEYGTDAEIISVQSNDEFLAGVEKMMASDEPIDGVALLFHGKEGALYANDNKFVLLAGDMESPYSEATGIPISYLPVFGADRIDILSCNSAVAATPGLTPKALRSKPSLLDDFKRHQKTTITGWHGKLAYSLNIPRLSNWQRYKVPGYPTFEDVYGTPPKGRIVK